MKSVMIAAALAVFALCAPASASAQQDICSGGKLPPGYTARDVQKLCAGRFITPRINIGLNTHQRWGHESRMGYGHRRGSCSKPGFAPNRDEGTCERTVILQGGHPKYDKPHTGCQKGEKKEFQVPLPNGGTRTVRQTCR